MSKIKKWALAIGIAVIFNLFINYGVATFHESPEYEDYCNETITPKPAVERQEYNDTYYKACNSSYSGVRQKYDANVFIILVAVGIAAIISGIMIKREAVASGFMFGGILSVIIGAMRYWSHMHDLLRFIILGAVLALLVWVGYKKVKD